MELLRQLPTFNKLLRFEGVCGVLKGILFASFILLSAQNVASQEIHQKLPQSTKTENLATPSLKKCEMQIVFPDSLNEIVEIPTFSLDHFSYDLKKYSIDQSNPMTTCPNGETPRAFDENTILQKADFDQEFGTDLNNDYLFEVLRSAHVLFDNGYLSVGNRSTETAVYYTTDEFCIAAIEGKGIETTVEFKTCPFSSTRPILPKCCPVGMMLGDETCVKYNKTEKWDPKYLDAKTKKFVSVEEANPVFTSPRLPCSPMLQEWWHTDDCFYLFHPVTDNTIGLIGASRGWEYFEPAKYWCLGTGYFDGQEKMALVQCEGKVNKKMANIVGPIESYPYMITMFIGAFFHLLTTAVHIITWRKQNIHGRTLCSCTASLFCMQYFLGTAHLMGILEIPGETPVCIVNAIAAQFFMVAAFTWLLVVNFDLWKTFGTIRPEGGSSLKRFLLYSLAGWGFPLFVSIISISLEFGFHCPTSGVVIPDYGKHYCFVSPWAQGPYVYYILGVLNTVGLSLAVLTMYELYKWKKDTANLRSSKGAADRQTILLFLKLSAVMGLTWIFETISWLATKENENHIGWIIIDLYNSLSAIFIFVIFVCKSATLSLLEQTLPCMKGVTERVSKLVSTFSGESSSDNTVVSTRVEESRNNMSNSVDSQSVPAAAVRYIKRDDKDYGSTNTTFK